MKEENKKHVEYLLKKSRMKEANGLNGGRELEEAVAVVMQNPAPQEEVAAHVENYTELALSLLEESLSDIPAGRAVQFLTVMDREYARFKEVYKQYKKAECSGAGLYAQFDRFYAASDYLSGILGDIGDGGTVSIPELDNIQDVTVNYTGSAEMDVYLDALDKILDYYDALIAVIHKAVETGGKIMYSTISFCMDTANMYTCGIINFLKEN